MSSNPNFRRPEEGYKGNKESADKNALPTDSIEARGFPARNISQSLNFHSTIIPFRQSGSPSSLAISHNENSPHSAHADATSLPNKVTKRRATLRASVREANGNDISNHLDMPGWLTVKIEYKRHETLVHAVLTTEVTDCLWKDCGSTNIKANGPTKVQHVPHTPLDGRPRRIAYRRQCYLCKDCERTSLQPVRGLYKGKNMTRRLRRYIARQSLLPAVSFSSLAKETGKSERNIRGVFKKHITHLENIREIETPRVMGMDGVYAKRQQALIVTDLERGRAVLMRPSIRERAVAVALREMPNLDKVEEVVADMAGGLDRVQKEVIPNAIRTKDRYHVQRLANAAVDKVRRAVTPSKQGRKKGQSVMCRSHIFRKRRFQLKDHDKANLDWCLGLYPELRLTYELKEVYCEFWNFTDSTTARQKYAEWLELHKAWKKEMPKDLRGASAPLIRLMKNWEEGIFNYFHARHTNARTESANARVKAYTSKAPRANFDTISAKMVHGIRLEQQREAIRQRGKRRRESQHTKRSTHSPAVASVSPVQEPHQVSETQVPHPELITVPVMEMGARLDLTRIAERRKKLNEDQNATPPLSSQMSLFE